MGRRKTQSDKIQLKKYLPITECLDLDTVANSITITMPKGAAPAAAQASVLMNVHYRWKATMYWCAYFIQPDIDITRSPFRAGSLKRTRDWAEFCYELKRLTRFCWENDPALRNKFRVCKSITPWRLWIAVLRDLQDHDYREAARYSSKPKTDYRSFFKTFLDTLKKGTGRYTADSLAFNAVLASTQKLRRQASNRRLTPTKKNDEFFETWTPTIRTLKTYIASLSKASFCTISHDGFRVEDRSHGAAVTTLEHCTYEDVHSLTDLIQGDDTDQVVFRVGVVDDRDLIAIFSVPNEDRWKNTYIYAKNIDKSRKVG